MKQIQNSSQKENQNKKSLYDFTIQYLKDKNVPQEMIQLFISRVNNELLFVDQSKAMEILQYTRKEDYVKKLQTGEQNKDYISQIDPQIQFMEQSFKTKEKERYDVSFNFLLKLLKTRQISKLTTEAQNIVKQYQVQLELIDQSIHCFCFQNPQKQNNEQQVQIPNQLAQRQEIISTQVQQTKQQSLYDFTIDYLKDKNMPQEMIQFFVSRVDNELLFIDQTKAMEILQYQEKKDYVKKLQTGEQNKDFIIAPSLKQNSEQESFKTKEKERYNVSFNFLLKLLKTRKIDQLNTEAQNIVKTYLKYLELIDESVKCFWFQNSQKQNNEIQVQIPNQIIQRQENSSLQVQQMKQESLYDFTIDYLKDKNVPREMIQFFVSRVNDELLFVDQTKAMEILQYTRKEKYVQQLQKGEQNKDYTIHQRVEGSRSENSGQFQEKERYDISFNFLLKLLKTRKIDQLNTQAQNIVKTYLKYLELIEESHIKYIQKQQNQQSAQKQNNFQQEELKNDQSGNLVNYKGEIAQTYEENLQLQVIDQQMDNLESLSTFQLGELKCELKYSNLSVMQKKMFIKLVELRLQVLQQQISTQQTDNQRQIENLQLKNTIELQQKDMVMQQKEIQYLEEKQLIKDELVEVKNQLEIKNQIQKYLESSIQNYSKYVLYMIYYDIEHLKLLNTKLQTILQQNANVPIETRYTQSFQEFETYLVENVKDRKILKTKDIYDMKNSYLFDEKQNLLFYIGITHEERQNIRIYEHYDSLIKLMALLSQQDCSISFYNLCYFIKQKKSCSKYFQQSLILDIPSDEKQIKDLEGKKIQELKVFNRELTNRENYCQYSNGIQNKIIHKYLVDFALKKNSNIIF